MTTRARSEVGETESDVLAALHVEVDGQAVAVSPGATLLHACRKAGVAVATFCHDERVHSGGHCRACLVEVRGAGRTRVVAACVTPAADGAVVRTETDALASYRRDLGELMWTESRPAGRVAEAFARWGVEGERYGLRDHDRRVDRSHPYLRIDLETCMRCRLCERACDAIQGQNVFGFVGRGADTRLTWGEGADFSGSGCVACGACASLCPTGAVSDVDRARKATETAVVQTTCGYCGVGCQLEVHVGRREGEEAGRTRVLYVDGVTRSPVNRGHLCVKGRYSHAFSRHPERLTTPLIRKGGVLEPATWDEALTLVADTFMRLRGQVGGLSSSRCTNEENYLLQKWMRAGLGTNNVDCCARVCHGPTAAGMRHVFGTGAATNSLSDIERADCLLVAGSNSTEAHPVTGARIKQRALAGATLIVIDPRRTELATLADVHLMLKPGTNVVVLNALAHAVIALGLVDHAFVAARTDGYAELAAFVQAFSPEATEGITGVPAAAVWRAAELYGRAKRPMQTHGLGMTEHYQGSESVMQLCNLAMLVGAIGREGVGVNPLRGQNNVQGAADMGCQPDSTTGYGRVDEEVVRRRVEGVWRVPVPTEPGMTMPRMYDAAREGRLKALFILGEDIVQTDPASHVRGALEALDMVVVQELFLTETAKRAHVVLPAAGFLEKDGTFTNGERRVQRVRKCVEPPEGAREDWRILCELMRRCGVEQEFSGPADIMDEIAKVAPSFAGLSHARLEAEGLQWPVPSAEHGGTELLHTTDFPVGKARFAQVGFAPSPSLGHGDAWPLVLVTGRVLEHYNCGSMTRRSDNALLVGEDALEVAAADALQLGLEDRALSVVTSPFGEARARLRVSERVAGGTAFLTFLFPETGVSALLSPVLDRLAECPEYKVTPIRVKMLGAL